MCIKMTNKIYKCVCGREFDVPQAYNGHRSYCFQYLESVNKQDSYYRIQKALDSRRQKKELKSLEEVTRWFSEQHTCERCGKIMTEKFGSGRFCSKQCANSRNHSQDTKNKISKGVRKQTHCSCRFCGKVFETLLARSSHEKYCENNSNKLENKLTSYTSNIHQENLKTLYVTRGGDTLNLTKEEINNYVKTHLQCEICGKTIEEIKQTNQKYRMKRLCIDHNHANNLFRGVLCPVCNRQLGWYEKNKESIEKYLERDLNDMT